MRVTNKLNAYNSIKVSQASMEALYRVNAQTSSGQKIENSFEDASTYISDARLKYEYATLAQIEDAATLTNELMKNTDKAMDDIVNLITLFKQKVTQGVNATQTQTSRDVIAKELTRMKEEIIELANTSINGQFLFSGSLTNTKPFDYSGNYYGDSARLNIVTGDGIKSPYNVSGYDLFFSADSDFKKQITTNVSLTDNRYDLINNYDKTRYLDVDDNFRYLIGLNYVADNTNGGLDVDQDFELQPLNFFPSALYVQGTRPDGTSFKSAVLVEPQDTIQGMLDKIGNIYGNTTTTKAVEVSINKSGQIQITDLRQGNNVLDFHAVAYTPQFQTRTEMIRAFEQITVNNLNSTDITNELLEQAFDNNNITNPNQNIQITIGAEDFTMNVHKTDFIFSRMTDSENNTADAADYDNTFFDTKDNKLIGNISQVVRATNAYATDTTRLSEVARGNLDGNLNLVVNSKGGNTYNVSINLATSIVSFEDPANAGQTIEFPIMHTSPVTQNSGVLTPTNDISYRQLNDVIGLFASDNIPTASINVQVGNQIAAGDYQNYQNLITTSRVTVNVDMDYRGRISITDRLSTGTNIRVAMHDANSGTFPAPPHTTTANIQAGASLSFQANNALIIDEPNVDLINDLNLMIEAVQRGYTRADSTGENPRNPGMQGALERLDHLGEHLRKQRTMIGADQKAVENIKKRVTTLKVNVESIRAEVMGADIGQIMIEMIQNQITYQASLKASTTLSQLSLLNYM
ncbi:flagellar hook-associated protein FlgL [Campylobacter troglodytis]|uniref:flagellar hook-associated protein FlgL n=1 Tax=Campylobacter troglodytis TaxID=654363 RepID=UPI001158DF6D|nr:flagellar hook-associated protein FlgL [Campylobacter troglodytis]TQR57713.1 flagellin biosynthesis protein FlgL [Campylobacter troglodytis]